MFENFIRVLGKGKSDDILLLKLKQDIRNGDVLAGDIPTPTVEDDPLSGVTLDWLMTTDYWQSCEKQALSSERHERFCSAGEAFKLNRQTILDSVSWMHERYQSQISLINAGETVAVEWTSAQGLDYYRWKQALRIVPQSSAEWESSITYPQVPQHVYDGMTDEIQALCTKIGCSPFSDV